MANLKDNIDLIISWLAKAVVKVAELMKSGDMQRANLLLADIQAVVRQHLLVLKSFIPDKGLEPMPGNFLKKIVWFARNQAFFNILVALTTNENPFAEAKAEAKSIAAKWGFYNEVYGG